MALFDRVRIKIWNFQKILGGQSFLGKTQTWKGRCATFSWLQTGFFQMEAHSKAKWRSRSRFQSIGRSELGRAGELDSRMEGIAAPSHPPPPAILVLPYLSHLSHCHCRACGGWAAPGIIRVPEGIDGGTGVQVSGQQLTPSQRAGRIGKPPDLASP